jgi:hypothetical protein
MENQSRSIPPVLSKFPVAALDVSKCVRCGTKVAVEGDELCARCEELDKAAAEKFNDFWKCLSYNPLHTRRDPSEMDSKVEHLTQEEAGIVFPTWTEERERILKACHMSQPKCLGEYIYLIHQTCIDRFIRNGNNGFWNALVIVVSFFNKDWCIRRYYDPGRDEDKKKGLPARSRGWKVFVFNPFDYMEWAMPGFKAWVVRWLKVGVTRKQLIQKAEEAVKGGGDEGNISLG